MASSRTRGSREHVKSPRGGVLGFRFIEVIAPGPWSGNEVFVPTI